MVIYPLSVLLYLMLKLVYLVHCDSGFAEIV
ncbi:Uncharacterised protein [Vibrio cholerae]|nr:Uncharacterised protein [Vibrio cholerae]